MGVRCCRTNPLFEILRNAAGLLSPSNPRIWTAAGTQAARSSGDPSHWVQSRSGLAIPPAARIAPPASEHDYRRRNRALERAALYSRAAFVLAWLSGHA